MSSTKSVRKSRDSDCGLSITPSYDLSATSTPPILIHIILHNIIQFGLIFHTISLLKWLFRGIIIFLGTLPHIVTWNNKEIHVCVWTTDWCSCTCWLVWGLSTLSRQLLHQEHEQGADLWLVAVEKGLVADLSLITNILKNHMTYHRQCISWPSIHTGTLFKRPYVYYR